MIKLKKLLSLFFTMFKIGLFTFGGGYAMVGIMENELVERKNLIEHEEFLNLLAIAESTPGPIAINLATFVGYKKCGVLGSIVATLAICIPSFVIIFLISLFFNQFLAISWVAKAFKGIQVCVIFLIFTTGLRMFTKMQKNLFNIIVFIVTALCLLLFSIFSITFSSIFYILIGAVLSLVIYSIAAIKSKKSKIKENNK